MSVELLEPVKTFLLKPDGYSLISYSNLLLHIDDTFISDKEKAGKFAIREEELEKYKVPLDSLKEVFRMLDIEIAPARYEYEYKCEDCGEPFRSTRPLHISKCPDCRLIAIRRLTEY